MPLRVSAGCGGAGRHHGGVFDGVEKLAAEVVHAGGEFAQSRGELVVADDGRNRRRQGRRRW